MIISSMSLFGFDLFGMMPASGQLNSDPDPAAMAGEEGKQGSRDGAGRVVDDVRDQPYEESLYWLPYPIY
jgi:hypothetical protein